MTDAHARIPENFWVVCTNCGDGTKDHRILHDEEESNFEIYPDQRGSKRHREASPSLRGEEHRIPDNVWKMYWETLEAINAGIKTLAGGGLRAIVEAICLDKGIEAGRLYDKIEELAKKQLITPTEALFLHEERFLGNAALHEMSTPSVQDLEDGLGIIEGLISTTYILPSKYERMKQRREARNAAETKPKE